MEENTEVREDRILGFCALSSDLPAKLLRLLPGSWEWTRKTVRGLESDKLLKRHQKNGVTSLRLTKKGRDLLIRACPERFRPIFTDAYLLRCRKSDPISIERIHRAAAVYMLMQMAEIRVYPDEKADVFNPLDKPVPSLWYPSFYTSLEVKARGMELTRIKSTRAIGVLLASQSEAFLVYNTAYSPLKWSPKAEQKMMGAVKGILLGKRVPVSEIKGLMIGGSMGTALELLQSTGGGRRQNFWLDGTFSAFYFATCGRIGIRQIQLLCCPAAREALAKRLRGNCEAPYTPRFDYDAVWEEKPVLFACEFDMEKIRRFKTGLELFGEKGIVCCFDYQAECLSSYFSDLAQLRPLCFEKLWRELAGYGT